MQSGAGLGAKPNLYLPSPRSLSVATNMWRAVLGQPTGAGSTYPPGSIDIEAVDVESEEGDDVRQDGEGDRQAEAG